MKASSTVQAAPAPAGTDSTPPRSVARGRWTFVAAVVGVVALAVAFRCWRLASVPPGLYIDELLTARNAFAWRLDPHASWLGTRPLLQPGWVETSNLYLAFASAVLRLGGDGLLGVRLISVLPSLAAVALLYLLARQLADRRTALLAAFLLGCSHWAARSGRTGWDAVLLVALQLAALACLAKARRFRTLPPALAGGGLLGASLYTYVAARLAVLQAVVWLAWEAFAARRRRAAGDDLPAGPPRALAQLALCVGGMVAVAGPFLLRLWLLRPELLTVRVAELSVFARHGAGEPWLTLGRNLLGHLLMFHVRGGAYARDALPGFPMLDPITGALLLAGLVVVALAGDWRRRLLLSWPLVMVLGGVLSTSGEGPPFPYRVSSLAPWSCLVAALGGVALWDAATGSFAATPRRRLLARGIAAVALAAVVVINGWALLVAWPADPGTRRAFGTTPTRVGRWLAVHRAGRPTLILRGALRPPALPAGYPYAAANRTDFFREGDAVAAVQLAAGLYRAHPARALAPLLPGGDVDFATALPGALAAPTLLVMAPERAAEATRRFAVAARWELRDDGKGPLVTILLAQP